MAFPGARFIFSLVALSLLLNIGWPDLWPQVRYALVGHGESVRDYRVLETTADFDVCRSANCTYSTTALSHSALLAFDTPLLLPPVQRFTPPEGKMFVDLALEQGVPFISMEAGVRGKQIAMIVPTTYDRFALKKLAFPGVQLHTPGIVTALQALGDNQQQRLDLWRNAKAWNAFVKQSRDDDAWQFSFIEFQPVPVEWRFSVPPHIARTLRIGDAVTLDFGGANSKAEVGRDRFSGRVGMVVAEGEGDQWIVTALPVGERALDWLASRVAVELINVELNKPEAALPEQVHVMMTPSFGMAGAGNAVPLILPKSAVLPIAGSAPEQGIVWVIVDNFLLPLQVRIRGIVEAQVLIEEVPISATLPINEKVWMQLTPQQRSRVLSIAGSGRKSLMTDDKQRVVLHPSSSLRVGASARAEADTTPGKS